jgi:hypothetical protein
MKDWLGNQREGSEWEPKKILLEEWTQHMPQIHKQGWPTRAYQGRVVTTDLPTLGTSLKQTPSECATLEAGDLADLRDLGRTVHVDGVLTVDYRIKIHMDLQADKSTVVVKGPFFPWVVNPRYRICGTMCNARIQSSKARKANLWRTKLHLIY